MAYVTEVKRNLGLLMYNAPNAIEVIEIFEEISDNRVSGCVEIF